MRNQSFDPSQLIGREITASVGEPWDFTSEAGDNILRGRVTEISGDSDEAEWIICEVSPFLEKEAKISTVAAVERYSSKAGLIQELCDAKKVGANLLYDPEGTRLQPQTVREALISQRGLKFLAGSIQLT